MIVTKISVAYCFGLIVSSHYVILGTLKLPVINNSMGVQISREGSLVSSFNKYNMHCTMLHFQDECPVTNKLNLL